jgi:hypothetical protein
LHMLEGESKGFIVKEFAALRAIQEMERSRVQ